MSFLHNEDTENRDGETIFRDVTVDKCNNMTCVDLKTVFSIPNDEEFNTRLFNVSLLPDAETDVPQSGMFRVSTDVVMFAIRDDDCKLCNNDLNPYQLSCPGSSVGRALA